jgi:preprotein translocase subunit SecE
LRQTYGSQGNQAVRFLRDGEAIVKKVITFLKEAREELGNISWPSRDEVTRFTFVVILAIAIMSAFLWVVDSSLMYVIKFVMR